jgi:O-antigen/teichoic acid export membrane protein
MLFASILYPITSGGGMTERFTLVMIAGLLGNLMMTLLTWWYTSRHHPVRFGWDTLYMKHMLLTSLPYGIALFLNVIFFKVDIILLSLLEPENIANTAIALYSLPMKIVEVGMMYGTVFLNSLLPVLTESIEKKDKKTYEKLTKHAFLLLFTGGLIGTVILSSFAPEIIRLISTEAFISTTLSGYGSIDALRIVAWIFLVYFLSSLSTYILIARGEQKKMMYINA